MNKPVGVVISSNKEEIDELKKKWERKKRLGQRLFKIGSSGFVVTILSPFDFEGPVAEIISASIAFAGFGLKQTAEYKIENLEEENKVK